MAKLFHDSTLILQISKFCLDLRFLIERLFVSSIKTLRHNLTSYKNFSMNGGPGKEIMCYYI